MNRVQAERLITDEEERQAVRDLVQRSNATLAEDWKKVRMADDIEILADPRAKISVNLVGVRYEVEPPKTALAIQLARQASTAQDDPAGLFTLIDTWMDSAFGKPMAKKVRARMQDPTDALDFPHVMRLMEALVQRAANGNPTSSS